MFDILAGIGVISAFSLLRLGESRQHKSNLEFLMFAGAEETAGQKMRQYYRLEWIFLFACILEFILFHKSVNLWLQVGAIVLLMASAGLRVWTIQALGRHWTRRCLYIPGYPRVTTGPYRFFKHPEYLARFCETIGLGLFLGAYVALAVTLVLQAYLLFGMIKAESKQLAELSTTTIRTDS